MAVYRIFHELFNKKFNVVTVMADMTDLEAVKKTITPGTRLAHIKTPDNPTVGITDIEAITNIAHENGALLSGDNTFASPLNPRIRYEAQFNAGSVISPFNAWQIFRSSVTFPLRMQRINDSSQKIAEWLEQRKNTTFVSYPGLPSYPGHELAKRQMIRRWNSSVQN